MRLNLACWHDDTHFYALKCSDRIDTNSNGFTFKLAVSNCTRSKTNQVEVILRSPFSEKKNHFRVKSVKDYRLTFCGPYNYLFIGQKHRLSILIVNSIVDHISGLIVRRVKGFILNQNSALKLGTKIKGFGLPGTVERDVRWLSLNWHFFRGRRRFAILNKMHSFNLNWK